jgi:hypothetical protein
MVLSVALLLVLATTVPVAAQGDGELPFTGAVHGYGMVEPDEACPPVDLHSAFTTTGHVTEMGTIELDYDNCTPEGAEIMGTEMTFVADNGDSVFATYDATDVPSVGPDPMLLEIEYDFEITGGTGQFAGATGGGQLMGKVAWPGFEPNYWPTLVLIDGTITY